jgi:hypothetical protein
VTKVSQKPAARQGDLLFEWPVPDVSGIGHHQPREISAADRAAINRTLPTDLDQKELWAHLEPVIKETRSPRQIIDALKSTIQTLEISARTLIQLGDQASAQGVRGHLPGLQDAVRYYEELIKRPQADKRLKKYRIMRAWLAAGGKPTVRTPDDPDREQGDRRGRGRPSGAPCPVFPHGFKGHLRRGSHARGRQSLPVQVLPAPLPCSIHPRTSFTFLMMIGSRQLGSPRA